MTKKDEIELSPVEATAYWWINVIRHRVRDLATSGVSNKREYAFVQIFYGYTEVDWRNVYLELTKLISEDVEGYTGATPFDSFSQDTDVKGHKRLNDELSKITGQKIPDIRLVGDDAKDSVIYTTASSVSVWYKSCGVNKVSTKYEPNYLLTGDSKGLDFYNLLLATIVVLHQEDRSFKSVSCLRERFSREYVKLSESEEDMNSVIELFNSSFNKINDKGIILGRSGSEMYFPSFSSIDLIGLESYMNLAEHYAGVILQKQKTDDEPPVSKVLKMSGETN